MSCSSDSSFDSSSEESFTQTFKGKEIVEDIFLLDFYEKKYNKSTLVDNRQLTSYMNYFHTYNPDDIGYLNSSSYGARDMFNRFNPTGNIIEGYLIQHHPVIYDILLLGNGKISICGICIVDIMLTTKPERIDMFFCCTVNEAKELLDRILEIIDDKVVYFGKSIIFDRYKLKICLDVFSTEEQILRGIGPNPERHGYNPVLKYFGTISSAICLSMNIYPIDMDFSERNISRYSKRGFRTILHGFTKYVCNVKILHIQNGKIINDRSFVCCDFHDEVVDIREPWSYYNPSMKILTIDEYKVLPCTLELFKNIFKPRVCIKSWFKDNYETYIVGISNDRFVMFSNIRTMFNVGNDIFKMLCDVWLEVEVGDVLTRLVGYRAIIN